MKQLNNYTKRGVTEQLRIVGDPGLRLTADPMEGFNIQLRDNLVLFGRMLEVVVTESPISSLF